MANNSRSQVRTPRRRKIWAQHSATVNIPAATPLTVDLLTSLRSETGSGVTEGSTVMRTLGSVELVQNAQATSGVYVVIDLGFAWIGPRIAALASGDLATPVPLDPGARDVRWLQQGMVQGEEDETGLFARRPLVARPPEACRWDFDFDAMGKMPTADSKYVLIAHSRFGGQEANTIALRVTVSTMLALP